MDELPQPGVVFWPVGEGDSTTVVVDADTVVQIDLHNLEVADDDDDPRLPIIDALRELLPVVDGKPYLAAFGLTHADEDHCLGFKELLESDILIGDLWFSPYILRAADDLTPDAQAFCDEARRRVKKNIEEGVVGSGDRVRVIGYHDLLKEEQYTGLPEDCLTPPGSAFSAIDGVDHGENFRVFVHGPVGSEDELERNDTSLAMQVTVAEGGVPLRVLLLGDLAYPGVKRVFDEGDEENLAWNVLLAPHHCSRSVFYFANDDEEEPTLKQDMVDAMAAAAVEDSNYVVASCGPIPMSNEAGDNPPHADARARYEEITGKFLVTGEHPNTDSPEPIVFTIEDEVVVLQGAEGEERLSALSVAAAIDTGRGGQAANTRPVGFGR